MTTPMVRNTRRVLRDYKKLLDDGPASGIWIKTAKPDEVDLFYVMLRGPAGSPYEGTLWFFTLEPWISYNANENASGQTYPATPPRVLHQSPWSIRAHPNLYHTGGDFLVRGPVSGTKVCLSILGTWAGPGWSPLYGFIQIFQTILSILDQEPLRNEPSYEHGRNDQVQQYTKYVQYCTLQETFDRILAPVLNNKIPANIPYLELFKDEIIKIWQDKKPWYLEQVKKLEAQNIGQKIQAAAYGDQSYVGQPYKFNLSNLNH